VSTPSDQSPSEPVLDESPDVEPDTDGEHAADAEVIEEPSATDGGEPVLEVLDSVVAERDELSSQITDLRDTYTRLAADFDNYKKRTARNQRDEVARSAGSIIEGLLPVLDGCDAAVQQGIEGVQQISDLLLGALGKEGLTRLDPLGDVFDPVHHEAVISEPAAEDADGGVTVVTEVMRRGYVWREQVLRPAMVKVQDQ
jgi:molecular chaperone GrpE